MAISILCVHGINHGDLDPDPEGSWSKAICDGLVAWNPKLQGAITCDFLKFDSLFEQAPLNSASYATAFAELLASGVIHSIGDLFSRERGLFEVPDKIRWTAGMVAQWVSDDGLKSKARDHILKQMNAKNYDLVCAHSFPTNTDMGRDRMGRLPTAWPRRRCAKARGRRLILRLCN